MRDFAAQKWVALRLRFLQALQRIPESVAKRSISLRLPRQ
jgi:hypothetical protein